MYAFIKVAGKAGSMLHMRHGARQTTNQAHIQKDDVACHKLQKITALIRSGSVYAVQKAEMQLW